ncbi:MAG: glycoside hydrolase family 95 protein [Bacteroidales bacterium]|nr:glycoside hydrolase family 95 protein [Bacteroidales bacterium]
MKKSLTPTCLGLGLLYILSIIATWQPLKAQSVHQSSYALTIWFDTPYTLQGKAPWDNGNTDKSWEMRSLPIGNGSIGANILGSIESERITFNEKTLWRGGPNTAKGAAYYWNVNKRSASILTNIREAFAQGDDKRVDSLTRKNFNSEVAYSSNEEKPFRFGNFTTAGEFYIATGLNSAGMSNYRRSLSLDSALVNISFQKEGVAYLRNYFISYPANVMVIRFKANKRGMQNLTFSYAPNPLLTGKMRADGNNGLVFVSRLDNNNMQFVVRIRAEVKGGNLSNDGTKLTAENADEVVFYVTADTDYKMNFNPDFKDPKTYVGTNPVETTNKWIQSAESKGYDALLAEHYKDYSSLFDRVSLNLNPDKATADLPTDKRLENYRKGTADFYLESLYYQYGRYLLIASSRPGNMPANLQGIWHNNVEGPWNVDYHNNINIQMNYWPALSTNLSECNKPLVDFIRTLIKPGKETAKDYFGTRGWTVSISANIFGFTTPLQSEDMSWNFSPMAGPWLATHIWDCYDYTRDVKFLKETGYPIIKGAADFAADYLWHKPDGTYTAAPSTSPEHGPIDEGATFAHAVIREILLDAVSASRTLGLDNKDRKDWEDALKHLAPYKIGRYGQLMEWSKDIDDPNDHHRHVNHLFGLHPGHTISPITTPTLAQAAKVVLEHRGDGATGWSMGWKLNQWARLEDGNHAYMLLGNLLKNGTMDNLWDTHPPFQIDGNFGGTAGMTEMLLQSHLGFIQLLPALPDAWKDGLVKGLCARGNFQVNMKWADNELKEATIVSNSGGMCHVRYKNKTQSFRTVKGKAYRLDANLNIIR